MRNLTTMLKSIVANPMFAMVILTILAYLTLQYFRVPESASNFDQILFYFIAGVSLLSALFMIVRTSWDGWTMLGSGLVSHFLAVSLVYFLSSWYATHAPESYTPELVFAARSLLIVSGIFVLIGVMKEWTERSRSSILSAFKQRFRRKHKEK